MRAASASPTTSSHRSNTRCTPLASARQAPQRRRARSTGVEPGPHRDRRRPWSRRRRPSPTDIAPAPRRRSHRGPLAAPAPGAPRAPRRPAASAMRPVADVSDRASGSRARGGRAAGAGEQRLAGRAGWRAGRRCGRGRARRRRRRAAAPAALPVTSVIDVVGGQPQRQRQRSLLALARRGCGSGGRQAQVDVVAVGPDGGHAAAQVVAAGRPPAPPSRPVAGPVGHVGGGRPPPGRLATAS